MPPHFAKSTDAFTAACRQELASPLRASVVDELRWFFDEQRRLATADGDSRSADPARYAARPARPSARPGTARCIGRGCAMGDRAVDALCVAASWPTRSTRQTGRIECRAAAAPVPSSLSPGRHGMSVLAAETTGELTAPGAGSPSVRVTQARMLDARRRRRCIEPVSCAQSNAVTQHRDAGARRRSMGGVLCRPPQPRTSHDTSGIGA